MRLTKQFTSSVGYTDLQLIIMSWQGHTSAILTIGGESSSLVVGSKQANVAKLTNQLSSVYECNLLQISAIELHCKQTLMNLVNNKHCQCCLFLFALQLQQQCKHGTRGLNYKVGFAGSRTKVRFSVWFLESWLWVSSSAQQFKGVGVFFFLVVLMINESLNYYMCLFFVSWFILWLMVLHCSWENYIKNYNHLSYTGFS